MIAARLAEFAHQPVGTTSAAYQVMALSVLDWASCALAAHDEPMTKIMREQALDEAGKAEASLVFGGKAPARMAALVNGTISHALDYDDTHFAHIGHPSVAVVPAALCLAERVGASFDEFLQAALIGVEASIRVGQWLGRDHYQTGFHQTATAGAFGACLAGCRLLGMDQARAQIALGLVSTRASGLKSQFGTMGKPFNAGMAATNGVEAPLLAARGFVSNAASLDGAQGFGPTHAGQGDMRAFDELGEIWLFETVSHKFHACCHGLHAMLEAIGSLDPVEGEIEKVVVSSHPRWDRVCNIASPVTGLEAKFSFRMTAAMALSGHSTARPKSFTDDLALDPRLAGLSNKVLVQFDEKLSETTAEVAIWVGGQRLRARHDLLAPMALEQRGDRVRAKSKALLGARQSEGLWAAIEQSDLHRFVQLIGRPR